MTKYQELIKTALLDLRKLAYVPNIWKSKLVDYESPLVERLWTDYKDCRLSIHKIHPCEKPLRHVHPWPAAVRVLSGMYEMEMGIVEKSSSEWDYRLLGSFLIGPGSEYDLTAVDTWHSVKPIKGPSISLMIMGKPWEHHPSMNNQPQPGELKSLHEETVLSILNEVKYVLHF